MRVIYLYTILFMAACCELHAGVDSTRKVSHARAAELAGGLSGADPWQRKPDASTLAWGESYLINALLNLYEATGKVHYLEMVAERGSRLLSHRDDRRGVTDGSGHVRPAWSMADKYVVAEAMIRDKAGKGIITVRSTPSAYNNFTSIEIAPIAEGRFDLLVRNEHFRREEVYESLCVSPSDSLYLDRAVNDPLAPYSTRSGDYRSQKSNLIRIEHNQAVHDALLPAQKIFLMPIPLAFTGYLGVIYHPLLRFAEIVKGDSNLVALMAFSNRFIEAAEESYADASTRLWRENAGQNEGYYLMCEKGESMPADNVGQPFNYLARHVCAELALYRLTGNADYLERSKKMVRLFKNRLQYDEKKDLYVWNYWYEPMTTVGWTPEDSISHNVKVYEGKARVEDISHGGHDIEMVMAAFRMGIAFDKTDIRRFANTFLRNVLTEDRGKITRLVDGSGDYQAYFLSIYQWLALSEVVPEVAQAGRQIYESRPEESLPFTAALLFHEK